MYDRAATHTLEKYNLTRDQVTAEDIQKYLRERNYYPKRKNDIEREEQIVEFYEELRGLNITF